MAQAAQSSSLLDAFSIPNPVSGFFKTAHDFEFESLDGKTIALSDFKGSPLLVVNIASLCTFTPQLEGVQSLWDTYNERGLAVVGIPSNDFAGQEPGTNDDIAEFCDARFNVKFPIAAKTSVIGLGAHPFFKWMFMRYGAFGVPMWNFHKFLFSPEGRLIRSVPPFVPPSTFLLTQPIERYTASRD